MRATFALLTLAVTLLASQVARAECAADVSDESLKTCLGQDLRNSDVRINAAYKLLMDSLDADGKAKLRTQQRTWLKVRDKICGLNNKQSDREKWLQAILTDQTKTVCVARFTFARVAQLDQMLKEKAPAKPVDAPTAPAAPLLVRSTSSSSGEAALPTFLTYEDDGYKARSETSHGRGRWYVEVWIDRGRIAELGDMLLAPGYFCPKSSYAHLISVRHSQIGMPPIVVGLAIDLDNDFFYSSLDGHWKVAPGQTGSLATLPGLTYSIGMDGSSEVRELMRRGLLKFNVGQQPFQYPVPSGYQAWSNF